MTDSLGSFLGELFESLHELSFEIKSFDNLLSSLFSRSDLAQPEALVEVISANRHN